MPVIVDWSEADVQRLPQIFRFSVWKGRPTPGNALMNLRYRDERKPSNSTAQASPDRTPPFLNSQDLPLPFTWN